MSDISDAREAGNLASHTGSRPLVSIICPVFNEEDSIPVFFGRLEAALAAQRDSYDFELIFTNNDSTDASLARILEIRDVHPWVGVVTLARNFGYQKSLMAGLRQARGDAFIAIDVDCEDPPEMIPEFLARWKDGVDLVYGERRERPEPLIMRGFRKAFYRVTKRIADGDFILDMAEFSLFSRDIRDVILANNSTSPFIRNEIAYAGHKRVAIPYARQARVGGKTKYNFYGNFLFAAAGMLSSSTFPLRLLVYAGVPLLVLDLVGGIYLVADPDLQLVVGLIFLNFFFLVLSCISIGMYVARMYKDIVQRPLFVVDRRRTYIATED